MVNNIYFPSTFENCKIEVFCIVKILVVYSCNTKYLFGNNIITINTHYQSS